MMVQRDGVPARQTIVGRALPRLPSGEQIRLLTQSWSEAGTGGTVWTSALALCRWMANSTEIIERTAILELGCGTGAAGLQAAGLGAESVCLTDGGPKELLSLVEKNIERNRHAFPDSVVTVAPLRWGCDAAPRDRHFDLVIGSDVAYHADGRDALCQTLHEILSRQGQGGRCACRAILAHEHRAKAGSLEAFTDAAALHGMSVRLLTVEEGMVDDPLEASAYAYKVSIVEVSLQQQAATEGIGEGS